MCERNARILLPTSTPRTYGIVGRINILLARRSVLNLENPILFHANANRTPTFLPECAFFLAFLTLYPGKFSIHTDDYSVYCLRVLIFQLWSMDLNRNSLLIRYFSKRFRPEFSFKNQGFGIKDYYYNLN